MTGILSQKTHFHPSGLPVGVILLWVWVFPRESLNPVGVAQLFVWSNEDVLLVMNTIHPRALMPTQPSGSPSITTTYARFESYFFLLISADFQG
jgi:hypothetical protein